MIVDASVALKWLVEEEDSDIAPGLLGRVDLLAPTFIHAEVGNAIWKKRQRGEFTDDTDLASLPRQLASLLPTIDEAPMMERALTLALEMRHPVYDCIYLAVAEALDQELVTADRRFKARLSDYPGTARVRTLAP